MEEVPELTFSREIKNVFAHIVTWEIGSKIAVLIDHFLLEFEDYIHDDFNLKKRIKERINIWNLYELGLLYEILTYNVFKRGLKTRTDYTQLVDEITIQFIKEINSPDLPIHEKAFFIFIFNRGYINLGKNELLDATDLLDDLWEEIETLTPDETNRYRYIVKAFYSTITFQMLKSLDLDFITQRNLIATLIPNFFNDENLIHDYWYSLTINNDIHPLIMDIIINGLVSLNEILIYFAKQLPEGENRELILDQAKILTEYILELIFSYLRDNYNFPALSESEIDFIEYLDSINLYHSFKYNIKYCIIKTTQRLVLLDASCIEDELFKKQLAIGLDFLKQIKGEKYQLIYVLDTMLLSNQYPFTEILNTILTEIENSGTIFQSTTFEKDIIHFITSSIDYLSNYYNETELVDFEAYEILISFTGEWMKLFLNLPNITSHVAMIFTAVVTTCLAQLTRGYYEINQFEKAFLTFLNLYYFTEYTTVTTYFQPKNLTNSSERAYHGEISVLFKELTQEWSFNEILSLDDLKLITNDIKISINKKINTQVVSSPLTGMIDEEIVFGFLDTVSRLETFLELAVTENKNDFIMNLATSPLYDSPSLDSPVRFDRIGSYSQDKLEFKFPFPLIRNIDSLATAISLFPQKIKMPDTIDQDSLIRSINRILKLQNIDDKKESQ